MDMYGIGAMSMQMSAMQTQYQAAMSVMKMSMELPEMAIDALLGDMATVDVAAATGLGQLIDVSV